MNKNKNIILGIVLLVLIVIAYFLTTERGEKTASYKMEEKLFSIDSALVDKLEIEQNGKKVVLVKSGANWQLTEPVNYPAYQSFVANALSSLKNHKLASKVSDNPSNKDRFGFNDTNYTKVTVYQGGNLITQFLVGNSASGPSQTYIKKIDNNEVFLADEFLWNNIVKQDMSEWRDKLIISIPSGSINYMKFESKFGNYTVTRDTSGNYFIGKDSCKKTAVEGILNLLQNFNTQGFLDTVISDRKYDFVAEIGWGNNKTFINAFKYGTEENNPKYLMTVSNTSQIFVVDENFLKNLFKPKKDLLN